MKTTFRRTLSLFLAVLTVVTLLPMMNLGTQVHALSDSEKYPGYMGVAYTAADVKKIVEDYWNTVTNGGKKSAFWNRDIRNDPRNSNSITQLQKDTGLVAPNGSNKATWYMQRVPYLRAVSNTSCSVHRGSNCTSNGFKGVGTEQPHNSKGQSTSWQCQGFAAYMAFVVFGYREGEYSAPIYGTNAKNVEIMVGDVLRIGGITSQHSVFVYDLYSSGGKQYARTIECNLSKAGAYCKINTQNRLVSDLKKEIQETSGKKFICRSPLRNTEWITNVEFELNNSSYVYADGSNTSAKANNTLLAKGTRGIAKRIKKNAAGEYWYNVTVNGVSGWIYAGYCNVVDVAPDTVTLTDFTGLGTYKVADSGIDLKEYLFAEHSVIKKVVGAIRTPDGTVAKNNKGATQSKTVDIIDIVYNVKNGPINDTLSPKRMPAGLYHYTLDVDILVRVSNGTSLSDKTFTNVRVWDDWFETYTSSASGLKMLFDANGGSVNQKEKLIYKNAAIGKLPTPRKVGSTFAGWYTAKTGGTKVTENTTFTSAITLYAHWDENVKDTASEWIKESYYSHVKFKVTSSTAVKTLPCSEKSSPDSKTIEEAAKNTTYTAIGLVENIKGNLWYKVTAKNGQTGYIYADDVGSVEQVLTDLTMENIAHPEQLTEGSSFSLKGTISTKYQKLTSVYVGVKRASDGQKLTVNNIKIDTYSYDLSSFEMAQKVKFEELPAGEYYYYFGVTMESYYAKSGKKLDKIESTGLIYERKFSVIGKPSTYTIAYNANGGAGAPSSQTKTHDVNLTLSNTKPTRANHTFMGWGTSVTATSASYQPGGTYTANDDIILYAVWKHVCADGHNMKEATCTVPETCSVCNATVGSAKGHSWKDATCTSPKTCSVCNATEGSAKGHSWKDATCTTAKTCSVCNATEGSAKGHSWTAATSTEPKTCTICGVTDGNPTAHSHNYVSGVCSCGAVKVNETTFPDANFRAYITTQEYGRDGVLMPEELNNVTYIDVSFNAISDLTGIEYFTALTSLDCSSNELTTLDVSKNTALTELFCSWNHLTSLDVSMCTALVSLNCKDNALKSLNVNNCTALTTLYVGNDLETNLYRGRNELTSLDVTSLAALTLLDCKDIGLTSLDVSKNTALTELDCSSNCLTSLNVSKNMALTKLDCSSNWLTNLDVSKNTALKYLDAGRNWRNISVAQNKYDLSNLVKDGFDITKASNWEGGTVSGNILTVTSDEVTYTYDLGNGQTESFELNILNSCVHEWKDATCTTPMTCKICGITEGSANGHTFDQEIVNPKYLVREGVYYKSCVCGATGTETFTVKEEKPEDKPVINFKDVPTNAFYYDPVMWAVAEGITTGTSADTFSPDEVCNRGQVVTFLWRAAGKPEPKSEYNPFADVLTTDFFYKAVLWAKENGITTGTSATTFSPNENCNRGQVVTFLSRALKGAPKKTDNPFTDVAAGAFYYNPVLWAVENGITNGTGADTFSPDEACNRGQVITFLYRAYK